MQVLPCKILDSDVLRTLIKITGKELEMKKYLFTCCAALLFIGSYFGIVKKSLPDNSGLKDNLSISTVRITPDGVTIPDSNDCCKTVKAGKYSSESIYQLNSQWRDQDNRKITLGKLQNKNVILSMFYASCQSACPVIVNDMKTIESAIPADKVNDYRFVLVTIDPSRDKPSVLKKYAAAKNLDPGRWTLLNGSKNDVMQLAMMLGFKYSKNADGSFTHSSLISFLNKKGEIKYQNEGLVLDRDAISQAIAAITKN
jgi:protein SCO1